MPDANPRPRVDVSDVPVAAANPVHNRFTGFFARDRYVWSRRAAGFVVAYDPGTYKDR